MTEFAIFAQAIALEAGEIMQSERDSRLQIQIKPDRTLVTNVDSAINELVIDAVVRNFPRYCVIGEEISFGPSDAEYIVRVDPLDGTGEYVHGDPSLEASYGFGLALQKGVTLETGLFFNPSKSEMFVATRGLGAYLNGKKIGVSEELTGHGATYDYSHWESAKPDLQVLETIFGPPIGHYSAIYQGCMVAMGRSAFSAFPGNTAHDIAPAAIIVSEAGGKVSDLYGNKHDFSSTLQGAIFSNATSHDTVIGTIGIRANVA